MKSPCGLTDFPFMFDKFESGILFSKQDNGVNNALYERQKQRRARRRHSIGNVGGDQYEPAAVPSINYEEQSFLSEIKHENPDFNMFLQRSSGGTMTAQEVLSDGKVRMPRRHSASELQEIVEPKTRKRPSIGSGGRAEKRPSIGGGESSTCHVDKWSAAVPSSTLSSGKSKSDSVDLLMPVVSTMSSVDMQRVAEVKAKLVKPKRPLSAYNYFFSYERSKLLGEPHYDLSTDRENNKRPHRKTHGKIGFKDLARLMSQKWKGLDAESKAPFEARAAEDMKRYRKEMEKYDRALNRAEAGIFDDDEENISCNTTNDKPAEVKSCDDSAKVCVLPKDFGTSRDQEYTPTSSRCTSVCDLENEMKSLMDYEMMGLLKNIENQQDHELTGPGSRSAEHAIAQALKDLEPLECI